MDLCLMSKLSRDVYDKEAVRSLVMDTRYKVMQYHWEDDGYAIDVREYKTKKRYIVVRGTTTMKNVITDLKYHKSPDQIMGSRFKTHSGFSESAMCLLRIINGEDRNISHDEWELYITGHSLGGAVACLAGIYLHGIPNLMGVVTFGQPKVMNKQSTIFANQMLGPRYLRVVNNTDPVVCMPPKTLYTKWNHGHYYHFGKCLYLNEDGTHEYLTTDKTNNSFWKSIYQNPTSLTCGSHEVDDEHDGNSYVDNINRMST